MPLSVLRSKEFSDAPRFQLWTDALCFRAMAKEAANNYLSSMCVRNAILSAWTTLEMACCDALGITKLERDFKESLHNEFDKRNIPRLDFGSGSWQEINTKVKGHRNRFMHSGVSISNRRESGSPIEVSGPGFIRINSDNKFDVTIHIPPQDYQKLSMFPWLNMPVPGTVFSGGHHFKLVAKSYLNGTWNGRVLMPTAGGTVGQAGLAHGTLSELRFEKKAEEELNFDFAKMFIAGALNFPALNATEQRETRGTSVVSVQGTYDHTKFPVGSEEFTLSHKSKYTELECCLVPGSLARNRHLRIQEALGYALCYPVWPSAIVFQSGRKKEVIVRSPDQSPKNFAVSDPPFHFANTPPEVRGKFFDLVSAYYRRVIDDNSETDQPLSRAAYLVLEALQSSIDVQILALGVAAEALIKRLSKHSPKSSSWTRRLKSRYLSSRTFCNSSI
jgi:hypothetical protein